jgi:hypothetical protein
MISKAVVLAVVFVLIASPATYKLTSGLLGSWIASSAGCATQTGVALHAAVFVAVLFVLGKLLMRRTYSGYDDDMETYTVGSKWTGSRGHRLQALNKYKKMGGKTYQLMLDDGPRADGYVWVSSTNKRIRRA